MKNFRLQLIFRVLLLSLVLVAISVLVFKTNIVALPVLLGGVAWAQIAELIRYIEYTNRKLERFFSGIEYDDFITQGPLLQAGRSFEHLHERMETVMGSFRRIRGEKEENLRYLEQVIHHLGIATISVIDGETIALSNPAARRLFQVQRLGRMEDLPQACVTAIRELRSGEKRLIRIVRNEEMLQLIISVRRFKLSGKEYQLVSFQNVRNEMAQVELEAWQKLIRVLTHEIMNSITPVTTLSDAIREMLFDTRTGEYLGDKISEETQDDIKESLRIVQKRGLGLMEFVDGYRTVTRIPTPALKWLTAEEIMVQVQRLFRNQCEEQHIELELDIQPANVGTYADSQMIEQVLINLVMNAMQALEGQSIRRIQLEAKQNAFGQLVMSVTDSGPGISAEDLEQIFVPFFTTKTNGTGVGLSISRQIMQAHGGYLWASSKLGAGASFQLVFNT
ncbi:ATP-binding protein [Pontibacter sp. G13]|uniref:sensor histidine kinase n=1 Tax=Pontibacter sp. G13 TaxID=3074898 RepID=UPI00288AD705|nr:ATP-binding protein [Pontibacter sp. G13]WNJ16895.1 ATP-binding protein [Pontibacter sp. G13]